MLYIWESIYINTDIFSSRAAHHVLLFKKKQSNILLAQLYLRISSSHHIMSARKQGTGYKDGKSEELIHFVANINKDNCKC